MDEIEAVSHRQQDLYWNKMIELKVEAAYIRLYRDKLGRKVVSLETLKAIASTAGIAAWAVWKQYAFFWGMIIAASQVADALKEVFPFTKMHKAASDHVISLDSMFIDAQLEWENIFSGRYTEEQIMNRLHRLRKLQHETERKNFPSGLVPNRRLFAAAELEAKVYLSSAYSTDIPVV